MLTLFGVHVTNSLATLVFRCALVTIFATGVGLAYYIPIGVFVVKIGKEDTATVSALMDIVGYAFGGIFFTFVLTRMVKHLGWFWVWMFYAGIALLSAFLATGFLNMLLETDWDTIEPEYICARKTGAEDDRVSLLDNDQQVL